MLWIFLTICFLITSTAFAQRTEIEKEDFINQSASSLYCIGTHDIGKLVFGITNFGMVSIGENNGVTLDCFSGKRVKYGEYPKGSGNSCLYKGGIWIGAVVKNDTLVSVGAETNNQAREFHPISPMIRRSSLDPHSDEYAGAISELDYICVYADTFTTGVPNPSYDAIDHRMHRPLGVKVTQRSFSWSHAYADDWTIIEYTIENIGKNHLNDLYVGVFLDIDIHSGGIDLTRPPDPYGRKSNAGGSDDIGGFLETTERTYKGCTYIDTINTAWTADNDGDYSNGEFVVPHVAALCLLGSFLSGRHVGFNWWSFNYSSTYDFGPQAKGNYRYMGNGYGTPYGDRNKYSMLSNEMIDYDPMYAQKIQPVDHTWIMPSPNIARKVTRGFDMQYVLSIGPFDMSPGSEIVVPVAFVAGENLHTDNWNYYSNLVRNCNPNEFKANLDFSGLIQNATVAERVYDIPGVDTDGDGYSGKFHICETETVYYEGDGTPDLCAASPPPAPDMWLYPTHNGIRVRFNGLRSETTPDVFSDKIDFEGYRIYIGRDDREKSFSMLASYDHENYDKHTWTHEHNEINFFQIMDNPFTMKELRCLYSYSSNPCNDSLFDPLSYTRLSPYVHPDFPEDSIFFFTKHDYNQSILGSSSPIRKIYPDQPPPKSLENFTPDELTDDGYPKYYEYEFLIEDLLPNVPYYVSATAFDVGSPKTKLQSLESSIVLSAKRVYPDNTWDPKANEVDNVYVFPNPYRQDAWYRVYGLEGRGQQDRSRERVRIITFANLPPHCKISIFSLDGDLIREMEHDRNPSDPTSSYHEWDLVSRNTQAVVSGLYYWIVEDEDGNSHIGKLVILL